MLFSDQFVFSDFGRRILEWSFTLSSSNSTQEDLEMALKLLFGVFENIEKKFTGTEKLRFHCAKR